MATAIPSSRKKPRAVAVNVLKGGFGKSTTAINLARELAERNGRVLLVDLDDNGHTTFNLGYRDQYESDNHVQEVLLDGADPLDHVVSVTDDLDLLPSHEALEEVETNLKSAMASSQRLNRNVVDPLLGGIHTPTSLSIRRPIEESSTTTPCLQQRISLSHSVQRVDGNLGSRRQTNA